MKLEHIGINFGDNDFYHTFIPLLTAIGKEGLDNYDFSTKEKFCELVNRSSLGFYVLHQSMMKYNESEKELEHTRKYLQITPKKVFFNEEVKEFLEKNAGDCNSEFFAIQIMYPYEPYIYSC